MNRKTDLKIRLSYDELAYLLALIGVQQYPFFDMDQREIGSEKAVKLVFDLQEKGWLIPDGEDYRIQRELLDLLEDFSCCSCSFILHAQFNGCPDLLCTVSDEETMTVAEVDYKKRETVIMSWHTVSGFVQMLDDEGYLEGIVDIQESEQMYVLRLMKRYEDRTGSLQDEENAGSEKVILEMQTLECGKDGCQNIIVRIVDGYPLIDLKYADGSRRIPFSSLELVHAIENMGRAAH